MIFTVVWKPSEEVHLADLWLDAPSDLRRRITEAARVADQMLKVDPQFLGELRSGNRRIVFIPPLALTVEVREDDRIVAVLSVHCIPDDR
jgi:hypothetical protein